MFNLLKDPKNNTRTSSEQFMYVLIENRFIIYLYVIVFVAMVGILFIIAKLKKVVPIVVRKFSSLIYDPSNRNEFSNNMSTVVDL